MELGLQDGTIGGAVRGSTWNPDDFKTDDWCYGTYREEIYIFKILSQKLVRGYEETVLYYVIGGKYHERGDTSRGCGPEEWSFDTLVKLNAFSRMIYEAQ
jgi:hypothetical protein